MKRLLFVVGIVVLGFGLPSASHADTLNPLLIGYVSFDSGVSPDGNSFDLYNMTGGFAGPPDSIIDDLQFSGTLTVTPTTSNPETFTFSGVEDMNQAGPATLVTVPDDVTISSAVLSITLSNSTGVNIYDDNGNPAVVSLSPVGDVSLNGLPFLTPCDGSGSPCSSAAVYVDAALPSSVPEPGTWNLVLTGMAALAGCGRRLRRT